MGDSKVNDLIKSAISGDRSAMEAVVRSIQDKVYGLCLRMLWQQEDAKESCQEILIKVVTHLSQFNFQSKFETWVYSIGSNHIIDKKRSATASNGITFSSFEEDLISGQIDPPDEEQNSPDFQLQLSEIRISCTTALLQCLDPEHRISYVLGEILEFGHLEAASILGITSANFRKRLERARQKVEAFTKQVCGVITASAQCQCRRRLAYAKSCGKVDFAKYPFVMSSGNKMDVLGYISKIDQAKRTAAHYRMTGRFVSPNDYSKIMDIVGRA